MIIFMGQQTSGERRRGQDRWWFHANPRLDYSLNFSTISSTLRVSLPSVSASRKSSNRTIRNSESDSRASLSKSAMMVSMGREFL